MLGDSSTTALASSSGDAAAAAAAAAAQASAPVTHEGGGGGGDGVGSNNSGEEDRNNNNNNMNINNRGEDLLSDKSFGGNRWPRQETLALLKIRSDMDVAFRDASVKGPLWDEVSRKLADLGYHRSAKKCKEKFENVYKYHKRTREGRTGKSDGKTYRFFDQLEALENQPSSFASPIISPASTAAAAATAQPKAQPSIVQTATTTTAAMGANSNNPPLPVSHQIMNSTVPSISSSTTTNIAPQATIMNLTFPVSFQAAAATVVAPSTNPTIPPSVAPATNPTFQSAAATALHSFSMDHLASNSMTTSSTSSDEETIGEEEGEEGGGGRRKRKRKWKDFFERLMQEVIQRQEELQKKFLEAIEKREHERMVREEAWRMQEISRINHEREILAQERSIAAAKDAAVMSFLQKISEQQNVQTNITQTNTNTNTNANTNNNNILSQNITVTPPIHLPQPPPPPPAPVPVVPNQRPQVDATAATNITEKFSNVGGGDSNINSTHNNNSNSNSNNNNNFSAGTGTGTASSSRWPKAEVHALIQLRTDLDAKYQENGPKGPLWEEISGAMRKLGYNRNAKRCKEKWENINKYFKKVKESNKKRPEDSKTCPYFHQLDALYRQKNSAKPFDHHPPPLPLPQLNIHNNNNNTIGENDSREFVKPENAIPLMVQPEQQWPPQNQAMEDAESDPMDDDPNHPEEDDEDEDEDDDDDDEDEGGNNYELVANKPSSTTTTTTASTTVNAAE